MKFILFLIIKILIILIPILVGVAFFTLFERKVMASIQKRRGPNVVGILGLLQPFADGLKLLIKETIIPSKANKIIFIFAPILALFLSFINWVVIPFFSDTIFADINISLLYIFSVSSLGVYSIIMSGWSSNSRYAFLGTLRSTAQMVSYEVSIGLIIVSLLVCVGSLNLLDINVGQLKIWYFIPLFPLFFLFFISALAETNRPPFDLPEAEAELVAGYFVEYSAMTFAQFFLGENINIIFMCTLISILFLGGTLPPINFVLFSIIPGIFWLLIKILVLLFSFIWIRVTFPRYRYDQLMRLGWKILLPLSLGWLFFFSGILIGWNWLP